MKHCIDADKIEVVDDDVADFLRRKTPTERIGLMYEANRFTRRHVNAIVAAQHPDWDESAVQEEVKRRYLNEDVTQYCIMQGGKRITLTVAWQEELRRLAKGQGGNLSGDG